MPYGCVASCCCEEEWVLLNLEEDFNIEDPDFEKETYMSYTRNEHPWTMPWNDLACFQMMQLMKHKPRDIPRYARNLAAAQTKNG